jgi:thiol-disulfide isomerase/thioredoxin
MLNQKYFGFPLWTWLVVIGFIIYYHTQKSQVVSEKVVTSEILSVKKVERFSDNKKIKIFNFNTTWCGWSKKFQPEWDKFSQVVKTNSKYSNVDVHDIKCDDINNEEVRKLSEEYQVPGFPYVVIDTDDDRYPYKGPRTADSLLQCVSDIGLCRKNGNI